MLYDHATDNEKVLESQSSPKFEEEVQAQKSRVEEENKEDELEFDNLIKKKTDFDGPIDIENNSNPSDYASNQNEEVEKSYGESKESDYFNVSNEDKYENKNVSAKLNIQE